MEVHRLLSWPQKQQMAQITPAHCDKRQHGWVHNTESVTEDRGHPGGQATRLPEALVMRDMAWGWLLPSSCCQPC